MNIRIALACLLVSSVTKLVAEPVLTTEAQLQKDVATIAEEIEKNGARKLVNTYADAVVLIYTISNSAEDDGLIYNSAIKRRLKKHHYKYGVVSGVLLSKDGIICTTYNGVINADDIIVSVGSEYRRTSKDNSLIISSREYRATTIKLIPELNLAFLRIKPRQKETFQYLALGNDAVLINGQDRVLKNGAVVIGKAKGENFVTVIRPANAKNNFYMFAAAIEKLTYKKMNGKPILLAENPVTSTVIVPENDGGAIIDFDGKLIGIAVLNDNDLSYSTATGIPVSIIKQGLRLAVPDMITGKNAEKLGITVVDCKDVKIPKSVIKALRVSGKLNTFGVKVESVIPKSTADNAEIQPGDIILKFNNDIVKNSVTYNNMENSSFGTRSVFLKILRKNKLFDIEIN